MTAFIPLPLSQFFGPPFARPAFSRFHLSAQHPFAETIRIRLALPQGVDALSVLLISAVLLIGWGLAMDVPVAQDSLNTLLTIVRQGTIAQLPYAHSGEIY